MKKTLIVFVLLAILGLGCFFYFTRASNVIRWETNPLNLDQMIARKDVVIEGNVFVQRDVVDGASRFTVQNMSNGTSSSGQVNLKNDVGDGISLGVGSSALNLPGTEGACSGALIHEGDANMMFGILYNTDYVWKNNPLDDGVLANLVEGMRLSGGELSITGVPYIAAGNIVCVRPDGALGTCLTQPVGKCCTCS